MNLVVQMKNMKVAEVLDEFCVDTTICCDEGTTSNCGPYEMPPFLFANITGFTAPLANNSCYFTFPGSPDADYMIVFPNLLTVFDNGSYRLKRIYSQETGSGSTYRSAHVYILADSQTIGSNTKVTSTQDYANEEIDPFNPGNGNVPIHGGFPVGSGASTTTISPAVIGGPSLPHDPESISTSPGASASWFSLFTPTYASTTTFVANMLPILSSTPCQFYMPCDLATSGDWPPPICTASGTTTTSVATTATPIPPYNAASAYWGVTGSALVGPAPFNLPSAGSCSGGTTVNGTVNYYEETFQTFSNTINTSLTYSYSASSSGPSQICTVKKQLTAVFLCDADGCYVSVRFSSFLCQQIFGNATGSYNLSGNWGSAAPYSNSLVSNGDIFAPSGVLPGVGFSGSAFLTESVIANYLNITEYINVQNTGADFTITGGERYGKLVDCDSFPYVSVEVESSGITPSQTGTCVFSQ